MKIAYNKKLKYAMFVMLLKIRFVKDKESWTLFKLVRIDFVQ